MEWLYAHDATAVVVCNAATALFHWLSLLEAVEPFGIVQPGLQRRVASSGTLTVI
jgi:hypothetical protein